MLCNCLFLSPVECFFFTLCVFTLGDSCFFLLSFFPIFFFSNFFFLLLLTSIHLVPCTRCAFVTKSQINAYIFFFWVVFSVLRRQPLYVMTISFLSRLRCVDAVNHWLVSALGVWKMNKCYKIFYLPIRIVLLCMLWTQGLG